MTDEMVACQVCGKQEKADDFWMHDYKMCFRCYQNNEDNKLSKEAIRCGEITAEDMIICPWCGERIEDDVMEYRNCEKFTCPKCEKVSTLAFEWVAYIHTERKGD